MAAPRASLTPGPSPGRATAPLGVTHPPGTARQAVPRRRLDPRARRTKDPRCPVPTGSLVETLIKATYDEAGRADVLELDGISGTFANVREAIEHVGNAYAARPDLDSIRQLAEVADQVRPFTDQVDVLIPAYYGNFFTLTVMALALGVAWALAQAVGCPTP